MCQVGPTRKPNMAVMFLNINRNKRSVVLDLKREQARRALLRLIDGADVLVHNMRVGAAERLGLSYTVLAARNPRLIPASATGFRKDGRHRDRPAFDDVIQGISGLAALNAMRDGGEPRYVPSAIADKFCGHVLASAVAMALYRRERTGRGQEVHVPMLETMISFKFVEHLWGGALDDPSLGLGYGRMFTPYRRPFPTSDGHLCLMANSDDQWQRLLAALGRPDLAKDPSFAHLAQRAANIGALYAIVEDVMRTCSTAEWQARLDAADVPNEPVRGLADLLEDDYLVETGFFPARRALFRRADAGDGGAGGFLRVARRGAPAAAAPRRAYGGGVARGGAVGGGDLRSHRTGNHRRPMTRCRRQQAGHATRRESHLSTRPDGRGTLAFRSPHLRHMQSFRRSLRGSDSLKEFSTIGIVAIASVTFAAHPAFLRTLPGMIGWCAPTSPDRG